MPSECSGKLHRVLSQLRGSKGLLIAVLQDAEYFEITQPNIESIKLILDAISDLEEAIFSLGGKV